MSAQNTRQNTHKYSRKHTLVGYPNCVKYITSVSKISQEGEILTQPLNID